MSESVSPRPRTTDPSTHDPNDAPAEAKDQAREVAEHGRQQAKGVADTAREGASNVAGETGRQASRLVNETKQQLRSQADEQTHRVGGALHSLGERLDALADGEPEKAGVLGEYAEQFAHRTHEIAQKVDELGFDGVVRELSSFARRRPGAFLVSAAVAGFASSRLGRGVAEAGGADSSPQEGLAGRDSVDTVIDLQDDGLSRDDPGVGSAERPVPAAPIPTASATPGAEISR